MPVFPKFPYCPPPRLLSFTDNFLSSISNPVHSYPADTPLFAFLVQSALQTPQSNAGVISSMFPWILVFDISWFFVIMLILMIRKFVFSLFPFLHHPPIYHLFWLHSPTLCIFCLSHWPNYGYFMAIPFHIPASFLCYARIWSSVLLPTFFTPAHHPLLCKVRMRSKMQYYSYVWIWASSTFLSLLEWVQRKTIWLINESSLTSSLQSFVHRVSFLSLLLWLRQSLHL